MQPQKKIKYKLKEVVGERQHYRRIALTIQNTLLSSGEKSNSCTHSLTSEPNLSHNPEINLSHSPSRLSAVVHNLNDIDFQNETTDLNNFSDNFTSVENTSINNETNSYNLESQIQVSSSHDPPKLFSELRQWAINNKLTHCSVTDLLRILQPYHSDLPGDARTLLQTPRKLDITKLDTGEFCYLGLKNALNRILLQSDNFDQDKLEISFNIDGLPLFHSASTQFWPILGRVVNCKNSQTFVVAIFCGKTKPKPLELFFKEFIEEFIELSETGIEYNNSNLKLTLHSFVCDAPAKAFIKNIKSHGGYSSCDKCVEPGQYVNGRVILRSTSCLRRTDQAFLMQQDEDHHTGISPLLKLQIGMVSCFPIDYMHACCLGVMRKLLNFWLSGKLSVRFSGHVVRRISDHLDLLKSRIPREFNRKPRKLDELPRWKATEYRTFMLYLGPFILKDKIDKAIYENFLLFHVSMSILISKVYISKFGYELPHNLLVTFIKHCEEIFGSEFLVYNVHILCHLADDVNRFGPLDMFSAFPFENFLGQLKRLVKSPNKSLQQVCRRLHEMETSENAVTLQKLVHSMEHNFGPLPENYKTIPCKQFKILNFDNFIVCTHFYSEADSYCLIRRIILVEVHNIIKQESDTAIVGKQFNTYDSLYKYPLESKELNIFVASDLSDKLQIWPVNEITTKCIVFPFNNQESWVSFPIIHTL